MFSATFSALAVMFSATFSALASMLDASFCCGFCLHAVNAARPIATASVVVVLIGFPLLLFRTGGTAHGPANGSPADRYYNDPPKGSAADRNRRRPALDQPDRVFWRSRRKLHRDVVEVRLARFAKRRREMAVREQKVLVQRLA